MFQLEIAGVALNINNDNSFIKERLKGFLSARFLEGGANISLQASDYIATPSGAMISDGKIKWQRKPDESDGYYLYSSEEGVLKKVLCLLDIDRQWGNAAITYLDYQAIPAMVNFKHGIEMNAHLMIGLLFQNYLLHFDGVVIHASSLDWNGKGILFSAPSGTGKSTHVKLWQEYYGSEITILNDDTPAVRFLNGKPFVFGTPWSGSSNIHSNSNAPLSAVVLLQQASDNSIQQISTPEAISKLLPRVFLPYYDEDMMNKACDVFERIISRVPVYLLKCKPDKEAVELVRKWVK